DLQLEDVDGDGSLDVAFRACEGFGGPQDERQHSRPGDQRKWLYAYAITAKGFQSLFPDPARKLRLKASYDTAGQPVTFRAAEFPESVREYQLCECTLTVKNTSEEGLPIKPGKWFGLEFENAGGMIMYDPPDKPTVLKPGASVSQSVRFLLEGRK